MEQAVSIKLASSICRHVNVGQGCQRAVRRSGATPDSSHHSARYYGRAGTRHWKTGS